LSQQIPVLWNWVVGGLFSNPVFDLDLVCPKGRVVVDYSVDTIAPPWWETPAPADQA